MTPEESRRQILQRMALDPTRGSWAELIKESELEAYQRGFREAIEKAIQKILDIEAMSSGTRWRDVHGYYWIPEFIKHIRALKPEESR